MHVWGSPDMNAYQLSSYSSQQYYRLGSHSFKEMIQIWLFTFGTCQINIPPYGPNFWQEEIIVLGNRKSYIVGISFIHYCPALPWRDVQFPGGSGLIAALDWLCKVQSSPKDV